MMHDHKCYCGTSEIFGHETGQDGCARFMTDAPEIKEGESIDYPYKQQRGYHQHPCGCWSRWPCSINSLEVC